MASPKHKHAFGWVLRLGRVEFDRVLAWQRGLVKLRREGMARDTIILVEHPAVVTVGKNGHTDNYKNLKEEPFFIERGGDVTYHGPGQLVAYFIFDLTRRNRDVHDFMSNIQQGVIDTLADYGIAARKGDEYTGVWVDEKKIASIGVAIKKWISFHGVAINLNTDLSAFGNINPCGLQSSVMTSVQEIKNKKVDLGDFGDNLLSKYTELFHTVFYPVKLEEIAEDIESQAGGNVI